MMTTIEIRVRDECPACRLSFEDARFVSREAALLSNNTQLFRAAIGEAEHAVLKELKNHISGTHVMRDSEARVRELAASLKPKKERS